MIASKITMYKEVNTLQYKCPKCGSTIVRGFENNARLEKERRVCWYCYLEQPMVLNLILDREYRVKYYRTNILPSFRQEY